MLPRVIIHSGVSADGRMDWYPGDEGLYYEIAGRFNADAMLSGSNTMIAAYASGQASEEAEEYEPPQHEPGDTRQLLVIVDSRGRLRNLERIRREPYWRDVVLLCSQATPKDYLDRLEKQHIDHIVAGTREGGRTPPFVDLRAALEEMYTRFGAKVVRVDSGGILNGALLRAGLVDELSLLISPGLVGGTTPRSVFVAPDLTSAGGVINLRLTHMEKVRGDVVWLRYEVVKKGN